MPTAAFSWPGRPPRSSRMMERPGWNTPTKTASIASGRAVLSGALQTSTDAIHSFAVDGVPEVDAVCFAGGRIFALGAGLILSSANGVEWSTFSTGATGNFRRVAFGNGRWLAVGEDLSARSSDGTGWEVLKTQPGHYFSDVAYGDGIFVAVEGGSGEAMITEDGSKWTPFLFSNDPPNWEIGIDFGHDTFVIADQRGSIWQMGLPQLAATVATPEISAEGGSASAAKVSLTRDGRRGDPLPDRRRGPHARFAPLRGPDRRPADDRRERAGLQRRLARQRHRRRHGSRHGPAPDSHAVRRPGLPGGRRHHYWRLSKGRRSSIRCRPREGCRSCSPAYRS